MLKSFLPAGIVSACLLSSVSAHALETPASHAIIVDFETGVVLASKNGEEPMVPASMTKMMTALMVFERLADGRLSESDTFTVSERAWREGGWKSGGSTMGLAIGEQVPVLDLLKGVIVHSGNDACIVIAEGISGSEEAFAQEMTQRAKELGLSSAEFRNATGLFHPEHVISSKDLASLAGIIIRDHPDYYALYATRDFTWAGIRQPNRNPLLGRFEGADGLKTGHLSQSGYGLTASAIQDDTRRIVVVNGLEDENARRAEAERLMRLALRSYDVSTPYKPGDEVGELPVWLGEAKTVPVVVNENVLVGFSRAEKSGVRAELRYSAPLKAPIGEGDQLGELVVSFNGEREMSVPVFAAASISKAGLVSRALYGLGRTVNGSSSAAVESSDAS